MAKLYFKYGTMNSSKTASALMCRFNYIQKGMEVLLLKPKIDNRYSVDEVTSRIGLKAPCYAFSKNENVYKFFCKEKSLHKIDVVIVDECQFCTKKQIEQLRMIADMVPVLCYGLLTNFKSQLFEGSKRLIEICDSLTEIKSVCACGRKSTINAKFVDGHLETSGSEIEIGAEEKYRSMCYPCFKVEQHKAKVYNKIIKYLKLTKNKTEAGDWSFDTSSDNVIIQKPYVLYDEDIKNFIKDFKGFEVKGSAKIIDPLEAQDLQKIKLTHKTFDEMMVLISYVLYTEKKKPGLLKLLVEDGTLTKWLRHIKKTIDNLD